MLHIEPTAETPSIDYDENAWILSIAGESYPENSLAFYEPVCRWLRETLPSLPELHLKVRISYMNAGSTKCMLDIIDLLREADLGGCDVRVTWFYEAGNDRARDLAEEFREDIYFPFDLVPVEGDDI